MHGHGEFRLLENGPQLQVQKCKSVINVLWLDCVIRPEGGKLCCVCHGLSLVLEKLFIGIRGMDL